MLNELRGIYENKSIAVLGSAPSVTLFDHLEDVAIGINGASKLLTSGDYFLSGDERVHMRSWFTDMAEGVIKIIRSQAALYCEELFDESANIQKIREAYESYILSNLPIEYDLPFTDLESRVYISQDGFRGVLPGAPEIEDLFSNIPDCKDPNIVLRNVNWKPSEKISYDQKLINVGGTSCCMGLQIAFLMGASEIHLYGVEFSNHGNAVQNGTSNLVLDGANYFYQPLPNELGVTSQGQLEVMDKTIKQIMDLGIPVYSHGPSRLNQSITFKL